MPSFWNFNGGIFWIERWQFKQLEIEAGVRFDYRWQQAYLRLPETIDKIEAACLKKARAL